VCALIALGCVALPSPPTPNTLQGATAKVVDEFGSIAAKIMAAHRDANAGGAGKKRKAGDE